MLTIPFFVLAGAIMAEGGMARRLVAFADVLVGFTRVRGGLSVVNVLATTFQRHFRLGGRRHIRDRISDDPANGEERISARVRDQRDDHRLGAGPAGAAEPQRGDLLARDRRHHLDHSACSWRASCPACCSAFRSSFCVWPSPIATAIRADRRSQLRKPSRSRSTPSWGLITLVIILGGILGGVFTAVEAGAVACVWAFFVTMFIYRDYRWRDLPGLVHRTLRTVGDGHDPDRLASSVGYVMALTQMPAKITAFFLTISSDKNVILFLINILLLVLGCLVDMAPCS